MKNLDICQNCRKRESCEYCIRAREIQAATGFRTFVIACPELEIESGDDR